ncbi:MAG TPA: dihydrofolate reductase [Clostridia bacterium]|jgi:dihydrofolate reductase|nr:dihydrofolate reductase [Clostridia bacterium]HOL60698.1 dihydrofolate reductase [Clostridia bacterium]HPO53273.1 dihydrofolate reductase [Clostridia bacterium]
MQTIVAVDKFWGIGKNNDLLFHLPEDLKYFKEKTLGKVIVMGGNTLLSLPDSKPLPNRTNIVLSDVFTRDDCTVVATLPELFEELKKYNPEDIFIVGGAMFYRTMLPYCDKAYVTKVDADGGAQLFFENLDSLPDWELESQSEPVISNGHTIRFTVYRNNNPLKY